MRTTVDSARHRRHLAELLHLRFGLGLGFLRQLGVLDAVFEFGDVFAAFVAVAQLALDRLHLLVQIILALRLLHLTLHAIADLPLDLQHADLAFDQRQDLLKPLRHVGEFEQRLLVRNLHA